MPVIESATGDRVFVRSRPCVTWTWCAEGQHDPGDTLHLSRCAEVAVRTADHWCTWTRAPEADEPCSEGISAEICALGDAVPDIVLSHARWTMPAMTPDAAEDLAIALLGLVRQARRPRAGD